MSSCGIISERVEGAGGWLGGPGSQILGSVLSSSDAAWRHLTGFSHPVNLSALHFGHPQLRLLKCRLAFVDSGVVL